MRSFVTSVSQARDQVQIRSGFGPSALPLRATSPIQRPFAIQDLSDYYPITGRRRMQSFPLSTVAATAISSIANPRRHPAVNHDPLRSLDVLSACGERAHPRVLRSFSSFRSFHSSSSSVIVSRCLPAHLPPAPRSSVRLVVSFASPLLRFSMIQHPQLAPLLLGFRLLCSVPSSSLISSWDLQCNLPLSQRNFLLRLLTSARNWFHQKTGISYMAGYRITPVLVFWTCRDLHCEFLRLWTGFELPSSWHTLPAYGTHLNRNILDFMR
jgi:hypothetical protein